MIYSILQSYLTILLLVAGISLFLLMLGLYIIFKRSRNVSYQRKQASSAPHETTQVFKSSLANIEEPPATIDITAIAGDGLMATQLDLARAYIETGKKQLATAILKQVLSQGSEAEQHEAQMLLQGAK